MNKDRVNNYKYSKSWTPCLEEIYIYVIAMAFLVNDIVNKSMLKFEN